MEKEKVETKMEKKKEEVAEADSSEDKKLINKLNDNLNESKISEKKKQSEIEEKEIKASEKCNDRDCHIHGKLKIRGRIFEGKVIKKFHRRVVIEFERMVYIRKYERYAKSKTKIHARLPDCIKDNINVGDLIKIQECRPLSKLVHFVVIGKIKSNMEEK